MAFGLRGGGVVAGGSGRPNSSFFEFNKRPGVNNIFKPSRPHIGASTTLANNQAAGGKLSANQQQLHGIRGTGGANPGTNQGFTLQYTANGVIAVPNKAPGVGGFNSQARPLPRPSGGMQNNNSIAQLLSQQQALNAQAKQDNLNVYNQAASKLDSVLPGFDNDPLNQASRGLASNLLANPEGINDRTQQLAINRASNLVNAGANAAQMNLQGDLAAQGQLGGSAEQAGNAAIDRSRMASLANVGSDAEIQRGLRRNQDITNAIGVGSGLANTRGQLGLSVASTGLSNLPQFMPEDLSGFVANINQDQGGVGEAQGAAQGVSGSFGQGGFANIDGNANLSALKEKLGLHGRPTGSGLGKGSSFINGPTFNQVEPSEIYREPNGNQVTGFLQGGKYTAAPQNTAGQGFMTPSSHNPGNAVMQNQQGPIRGSGQPINAQYDGGYSSMMDQAQRRTALKRGLYDY